MPDGVYVHVEALPYLSATLQAAVAAAGALAKVDPGGFDVVKLGRRGCKLSLLAYPGFFTDGFPVLAASWAVDLTAGTVAHRAYAAEGNPPILHRKETMLPPGHPRLAELAALTAEAERLGLFTETRAIGTLRPWAARLARLGVRVEGHRLVETPRADGEGAGAVVAEEGRAGEGEAVPAVQRHRTALQRYSLSTPMAARPWC
jgi:DNA phosphorothioation-associated putative methyltransferase